MVLAGVDKIMRMQNGAILEFDARDKVLERHRRGSAVPGSSRMQATEKRGSTAMNMQSSSRPPMEHATAWHLAPRPDSPWQEKVPTGIGRPALYGALVALAFVAGFGVWAATAPIDGAVVARRRRAGERPNQVVEHLEGGIVASIDVPKGPASRPARCCFPSTR